MRKSLVLLKNGENADEDLLPLPKKASKILVAGSHANDLGNQCGGWTITWQGQSGNNQTVGNQLFFLSHNFDIWSLSNASVDCDSKKTVVCIAPFRTLKKRHTS